MNSSLYEIETWIDASLTADLPYADYWNDEKREAEKGHLHITRLEDRDRVDAYLARTGIMGDLAACLTRCPPRGVGADLAAGICWPAPQILAHPQVERLYCVEYSRHRLTTSAPIYLASHQVDPDWVRLALGSFYDIQLPDQSLDFIVLAASFHHADDPDRLLGEVRRLLKTDGWVILIGEPVVRFSERLLTYYGRLILGNVLPVGMQRHLFGKTVRIPPGGFPVVPTYWPPIRSWGIIGIRWQIIGKCSKTMDLRWHISGRGDRPIDAFY